MQCFNEKFIYKYILHTFYEGGLTTNHLGGILLTLRVNSERKLSLQY